VLIVPPRPYLLNQKALPNLGILTVSSVFKELGHEVEVLDFADGWRFIEADLYGIYVSTPDVQVSVSILKWIKAKGAKKVICGGPHATLRPKECFEFGFDAVCVGDGEVTVPKVLNGEKLAVGWLKNIDEAPHPDRTCLDLKTYDFEIAGVQATSMMTCYGCIWRRCAFCCRPPHDVLRFHSAEWVIQDLNEIADLGFKAVMIYDDEFFTYPQRDMKIINALGEMGFTWRAFGHSRFLLKNKQLVCEASQNGLREVLIGVESGSNRILQTINKGTTAEMNKQAIEMLHNLNVDVKAAMIVMLPGESKETLEETWSFCEEVKDYVKDWDFCMLVPYPGSLICEKPEGFNIKFEERKIYTAYKGMHTKTWNPLKVSTSKLTFEEGLSWRNVLESRFKFKNF